jgi:hypothetical protein
MGWSLFQMSPAECPNNISKPSMWGGLGPYKDCTATDDDKYAYKSVLPTFYTAISLPQCAVAALINAWSYSQQGCVRPTYEGSVLPPAKVVLCNEL